MVFTKNYFFCNIVVIWVIIALVCDFKCVRGMQNEVLKTTSPQELLPLSTAHGVDSESFPTPEDNCDVDNSVNVHSNNEVILSRVKLVKEWLIDFLFSKKILIVFYMLVAAFNCGVHWNWPDLQQVYYKAGYFAHSCGANATGLSEFIIGNVSYIDCAQRSQSINNIFTLAMASQFVFSVVGGFIVDHFGSKVAGTTGCVLAAISWALFGIPATKVLNSVYYIAAALLGMSVEPLYSSLLSVSNLFPGSESMIIALFGTITTASLLVPIVMNKVYQLPFFTDDNLYIIFMSYVGLCILPALFNSIFLLPRTKYAAQPKQHTENSEVKMGGLEKYSFKNTVKDMSFIRILIQPEFYLMALYVTFSLIRNEFYVKTIKDQMVTSTGHDAAFFFSYVNLSTIIPCLPLGMLADRFSVLNVIALLNFAGVLMYVFVSLDYIYCKYISQLFFWVFGSFLITPVYCYVRETLPDNHFGKSASLMTLIAGLFTLLSSPLYMLASETLLYLKPHNFLVVNGIMMGLGVIGGGLCFGLWYRRKVRTDNFTKMTEMIRVYEETVETVDTNVDCTQIATPKTDHDKTSVGPDASGDVLKRRSHNSLSTHTWYDT